jgi:endogenous inhibitor of DNA gyrase (YacG/DUF329 family)
MADLGRWLREEYRVADEPVPPADPEHDDTSH